MRNSCLCIPATRASHSTRWSGRSQPKSGEWSFSPRLTEGTLPEDGGRMLPVGHPSAGDEYRASPSCMCLAGWAPNSRLRMCPHVLQRGVGRGSLETVLDAQETQAEGRPGGILHNCKCSRRRGDETTQTLFGEPEKGESSPPGQEGVIRSPCRPCFRLAAEFSRDSWVSWASHDGSVNEIGCPTGLVWSLCW